MRTLSDAEILRIIRAVTKQPLHLYSIEHNVGGLCIEEILEVL